MLNPKFCKAFLINQVPIKQYIKISSPYLQYINGRGSCAWASKDISSCLVIFMFLRIRKPRPRSVKFRKSSFLVFSQRLTILSLILSGLQTFHSRWRVTWMLNYQCQILGLERGETKSNHSNTQQKNGWYQKNIQHGVILISMPLYYTIQCIAENPKKNGFKKKHAINFLF